MSLDLFTTHMHKNKIVQTTDQLKKNEQRGAEGDEGRRKQASKEENGAMIVDVEWGGDWYTREERQ